MLYYLESTLPIRRVPHPETYHLYTGRLSADEIAAIESKLEEIFDSTEVHTAGWVPGSDWHGTVWEPIYTKGARQNEDLSGLIFGLVFFAHAMGRSDKWITGRFELNGREIRSLTYFRPQDDTALEG